MYQYDFINCTYIYINLFFDRIHYNSALNLSLINRRVNSIGTYIYIYIYAFNNYTIKKVLIKLFIYDYLYLT